MKTVTWIVAAVTTALIGLVIWQSQAILSLKHTVQRNQSQLAGYAKTLTADQAKLTADQARLAGIHRDLITCGDMQAIINNMPQSDSNGDTLFFAGPNGSLGLPSHCINQ